MHMIDGSNAEWQSGEFDVLESRDELAADCSSEYSSKMQQGKQLVISGFMVCVIGLGFYCFFSFSAELAHQEPRYITESLLIVFFGFLCWLFGAFRYIQAACSEIGESEEDIF